MGPTIVVSFLQRKQAECPGVVRQSKIFRDGENLRFSNHLLPDQFTAVGAVRYL
jgi:hypothetical protein